MIRIIQRAAVTPDKFRRARHRIGIPNRHWLRGLALGLLVLGGLIASANTHVTRITTAPFALGADWEAVTVKVRPAVLSLTVNRGNAAHIGTGTGFLVSTNGLFVTSWHVIKNALSVTAEDADGNVYHCLEVVAEDPQRDVAVLAIQGQNFPALRLGTNRQTEPGLPVALIGCPSGREGITTAGIISAVRELFGTTVIQFSNAMAGGSSGSPLVNGAGEVIGVASGQVLGETESQDIGCAIPVEAVKHMLEHPLVTPRVFANSMPSRDGMAQAVTMTP